MSDQNTTIKRVPLRIGIYLLSKPMFGGAYQYNMTMLEILAAVKASNPEAYKFVVITPHKPWLRYLGERYPASVFEARRVTPRIAYKIIRYLLVSSEIGLATLRFINRFRLFLVAGTALDLIVCPSQDQQSCEVGIRTISTIHDLMHRYESAFPEACSAEEFVVRERVCTRMCKYSKVIIVDSGVGKRQVEESYGKGLKAKTAILPFLPPPYIMENLDKSENDYVIHKFGLQEKFLFYPAAFWKHKNHHGLVEAIKLLGERGLNVNAVFVGPQKNNYGYVLELINKYKLKERITILGYVDNQDIVSLYKKSVALVMPSFFGPTNIPIIEAMFLGVPVLCANVYAMPEQVGDAGLVFDNTPEDMAMKIAAVWTDEKLRQLIREKALKRVQEFSLEKHAEKMKRILCLAANDE